MRLNLLLVILMIPTMIFANEVKNIRVWAAPDSTRIVLDLENKAEYKVFTLGHPDRIVVDIEGAKFTAQVDDITIIDSGIKRIRYGDHKDKTRIVFDLQKKSKVDSFMLSPNETYGHRLVIDLSTETPILVKLPKVKLHKKTKQFIVAIDPGHGGEDPGAMGIGYQTQEKQVVLDVAKKLKYLIDRNKDMHAFLVREGDYYVGLRKRMSIAREKNADIFISLHADSFKDPRAHGASVYVLSERGASSEAARWLAESENRADLIGGVTLEDKGDVLASVLLDLSQTATTEASFELAEAVLDHLSSATPLHKKNVQRAGFLVLKSPDVPSVLIELGFISNKKGEQKLRLSKHQSQLANAIYKGIENYALNKPKLIWSPDSIAKLQHRVAPGDTLYEIAQRYNVTIESLKSENKSLMNEIQVGDTIEIPLL